ncbi:WhiB family transcriptional regulator [Rhodococcoides yunnanense]|uniref:WhiB family transcriptional regulator n=1 Tax=Rhodococcoides yunnanense TaxID=278209 RepID=UPI0035303530
MHLNIPQINSWAKDWRANAHCSGMDTEIFFNPASEMTATAICDRCTVWRQCGYYARVESEEFGVWGGLNPQQRATKRLAYFQFGGRKTESASSEFGPLG